MDFLKDVANSENGKIFSEQLFLMDKEQPLDRTSPCKDDVLSRGCVSVVSNYLSNARSLITSPARISPATEGTKAVLPGISLRSVHLCAAPGGQMQ